MFLNSNYYVILVFYMANSIPLDFDIIQLQHAENHFEIG